LLVACLGTSQSSQLLGFLGGDGLGTLAELGLRLETHDTTTPLADQLGIVVVLFVGQVLQQFQLGHVFGADAREADGRRRLLCAQGTETSLVLDNHKGNLHLTAESGQPHDEFNGIDIVGNQDQGSLLLFHQGRHVFETKLDLVRRLLVFGFLAFGLGSRRFLDALLLCRLGLGTVLVEEGEYRHGFILAERLGKLVDGRRHLEALVEDGTLTLEANVARPLDKARQVTSLGTNVATDLEVTGARGKEGVGRGLGLFGLAALFGRGLFGSLEDLGNKGGARELQGSLVNCGVLEYSFAPRKRGLWLVVCGLRTILIGLG
jgi:hypothetical protein